MSDLTPRPINPTLEPAQPRALASNDLIRRAASDLTPFQSVRVGRTIQRGRMRTAVQLAKIEDETILGEAVAIAKAKVRSTEEQAERLLHAERMECLGQAALAHEKASRIIDLIKDEAAHALFKDALKGASVQYANGVIGRSG